MIRAKSLANVHQRRTIRPLYSHHQATPYAAFLDAAEVAVIFPGMVARQSGATEKILRATGATHVPFGLFANFINGDMDELGDGTEIGVWRGGPDATFEILDPAMEAVAWTGITTANTPLGHSANAKLTNAPVNAAAPAARLLEAPSATKIIVSLDLGTGQGAAV